jgi:hypothetical protein
MLICPVLVIVGETNFALQFFFPEQRFKYLLLYESEPDLELLCIVGQLPAGSAMSARLRSAKTPF